jgi:phenylpropionate dioxygenase-like ring-hydroxylating dioxygenase large terminal subunit
LKQFLTEYKMTRSSKSIHGLPAKYYTDQQFWEIECNTVLANGWLFVGFVHEFLKQYYIQFPRTADRYNILQEGRV